MVIAPGEPGTGRGAAAPSSHSPPSNSLLNRAGSWMSQTSAQTTGAGAAISRSAWVVGQSL